MTGRTCLLLVAGLLVLPLPGQTPRNPTSDSARASDSLAVSRPVSPAPVPLDAPANPTTPDSLSHPKSRADTVLVVKHQFDHREQIITGSVVMTCLALMMVVMNNYNPR